jgi:hypothetical protein
MSDILFSPHVTLILTSEGFGHYLTTGPRKGTWSFWRCQLLVVFNFILLFGLGLVDVF